MENMKNKYDYLGNLMSTRNENLQNKAGDNYIQTAARKRIKRFQDQISEMDTRSKLPQEQKDLKIKKAQEGINRMDKIINKQSNTGRPRTRSGQTQGEAGPRLSMLSTTSTMAAMTPRKK